MFCKLLASALLILTLSLQVNAHAAIAPELGVSGNPVRNDVQRPSAANECGNTNVAQTLDTSTPVVASANGQFTVTVTNFNAGKDGSRQVTATVDPTASGKSFTGAVTITKNGDLAPTDVGSQQVTASLPAGTTCTGGAQGNLCLVSFKTAGNFGNCVVVQQGSAAANGAAGNAAGAAGAAAAQNAGAAAKTGNGNAQAAGKANAKGAAAGKANAKGAAAGKANAKGAAAGKANAKGAAAGKANAKGAAAGKANAKGAAAAGKAKAKGQAGAAKAKAKAQARNVGGTRAARALLNGEETWFWA